MSADDNEVKDDAAGGVEVSVTCTDGEGNSRTRKSAWFNTVEVLRALDEIAPADGDAVEVSASLTAVDGDEKSRRVVFSGTAAQARKEFRESTLDTERVIEEVNKFITVVMSHSELRGIAVALVCADARSPSGNLAHGLARTAPGSTRGDHMTLYSTNAANGDKFAQAARIADAQPDAGEAEGESPVLG